MSQSINNHCWEKDLFEAVKPKESFKNLEMAESCRKIEENLALKVSVPGRIYPSLLSDCLSILKRCRRRLLRLGRPQSCRVSVVRE